MVTHWLVSKMMRALFLIHRYLGIGIGILMALWCLSGIVMMYVPYPELNGKQTLRGLSTLDFSNCCGLIHSRKFMTLEAEEFSVEMLIDRPVLRTRTHYGQSLTLDLTQGGTIRSVTDVDALAIAAGFSRNSGFDGLVATTQLLDRDQWIVHNRFDEYRPLHHIKLSGTEKRELYVSSTTGEVVQMTTVGQRFWNWIGSVVHWIYPTLLRKNTELWIDIVIWLSLAGIFLTVIGLYLGIRQIGRGENDRKSPYRGWALWHHYTGLLFGILILTWVSSGFLSVNPWGALESSSTYPEATGIRGGILTHQDLQKFVSRLPTIALPDNVVRLDAAPLDGQLFFTIYQANGNTTRYDATDYQPRPVDEAIWSRLPSLVNPGTAVHRAGMMHEEDEYYYSHHDEKKLPVYRIVFDDEERTRYYLDATNGQLVMKVDRNRRWYRWLFHAFHRWDFKPLRPRPLWDVVMLLLITGVTLGCTTGAWIGIRRLKRNLTRSRGPVLELETDTESGL